MKANILNDMARDMIGDGKLPNMFFVTNYEAEVLAVIATNLDDAVEFAVSVSAWMVEDRLTGEVWLSGPAMRFGDD